MSIKLRDLTNEELVAPGNSACPGCGATIGARMAMKVLGDRTIMINQTGCMTVNYGVTGATRFPYLHMLFETTGAVLSGVDAGLRALGKREGVNLLGWAGDGGTADIGFQSLSGAIERGHKFLYICYDNESYMNTGGQRSGVTPYGASTTTCPAGTCSIGEQRPMKSRKDLVEIFAAHGIPYAATASLAFPLDYMAKVQRAAAIDGPAFIHLLSPCPSGWGCDEEATIGVSKLAVETGMWVLLEVVDGERTINKKLKSLRPVEEYLSQQKRFRHLLNSPEEIAKIQEFIDKRAEKIGLLGS
jgi:pyruvate ferredoxin oxidoreductase beta subunit